MSPPEWSALIEAYLDGRLSAEAFERRFEDAWSAQSQARQPFLAAIETLYAALQEFAAKQDRRAEYDADETELRRAARVALRELQELGGAPTRTYDRARAREEMRRFGVHVRRIAGLGCVLALAWLALVAVQIYYVSELIQREFAWGAWPSSILGFFLAFVPILGNLLAYFGATGGEHPWPAWLAALVFFAAPAAAFLSGWRWRAWRRRP